MMPNLPEGATADPPDSRLPKIRKNESFGGKNLPPEANYDYPRSHASGMYQDQPRTWQQLTRQFSFGTEYPEAYMAPKDVQTYINYRALQKYGANSTYTWAASAPPGGYKKGWDLPKGASATPPGGKGLPEGASATPPKGMKPVEATKAPAGPEAAQAAIDKMTGRQPPLHDRDLSKLNQQPEPSMWQKTKDEFGKITAPLSEPVLTPEDRTKVKSWVGEYGTQAVEAIAGLVEAPGALWQTGTNAAIEAADKSGLLDRLNQITRQPGYDKEKMKAELSEAANLAPVFAGAAGKEFPTPEAAKVREATVAGTAKETPAAPEAPKAGPASAPAQATPLLPPAQPQLAQSLSAAHTPQSALQQHFGTIPPVPTKEFIRSEEDALFRLRNAVTVDKQELTGFLKSLPKEMRDPALQKEFFEASEPGSVKGTITQGGKTYPFKNLSPDKQALWDKYAAPWKREETDLWLEATKRNGSDQGIEDYNPEYQHRIVKGKSREFDPYMGESQARPQAGYKLTKAGSQRPRKFFVAESQTGDRKVITISDGKTVFTDGGGVLSTEEKRVGDKFKINNEEYEVKQAKASEIESATKASGNPIEYYKNSLASTLENVMKLRAVVRLQAEMERLKGTPEFAKYARPRDKAPSDWITPDMPMFQNVAMEPRLAEVLNDFWARPNRSWLDKISAVTRFLVGSLFWSPVSHAENAAAHWATARGWDWVNPKSLVPFMVDSAKAVKGVITQDKEYQRLLKEGSGMIYGSTANVDFYKNMLTALGEQVKRNPTGWGPIADAMDMTVGDLVRSIYRVSNRALWATSDVFMMQRVLELERKGMPVREAIAHAEKHIPNYRIPSRVFDQRWISQGLREGNIFEFSRYHFGQLLSFAHMSKELAKGTGKQRFDTMGNIFATGFLITVVWPALNAAIMKMTGDKTLEQGPKGSMVPPMLVWDLGHGRIDFGQMIERYLMLAPVPRWFVEEMANKDLFTGQPIREPGDWQAHRFGRIAAQTAEHAAQYIAPYNVASKMMQQKPDNWGLREIIKQGLGLRNVPKDYRGPTHVRPQNAQIEAAKRHARPHGLIEKYEGQFENWLGRSYGGVQ